MKDKQIEELIATIEITKELCDSCCDICKMHGKGCMPERMAKKLAQNGYRKSSDIAREIFEEIEEGVKAAVSALQFENNPIHRKVKHETYSSLMRFVKNVEKKYTESEKK